MSKKKQHRVFVIGKYKGRRVNEIIDADPSYVKWMHETFRSSPFTEKELRHLNGVWRRRYGVIAVQTEEEAGKTVYEGQEPALAGRPLGDICTTDLYRISRREPEYTEAAKLIIGGRNYRKALLKTLHREAPYFQTDDIPR